MAYSADYIQQNLTALGLSPCFASLEQELKVLARHRLVAQCMPVRHSAIGNSVVRFRDCKNVMLAGAKETRPEFVASLLAAVEHPRHPGPDSVQREGVAVELVENGQPRVAFALIAKAQLFPRQKLMTEQNRIAMLFEPSMGMRAFWTRIGISARFPSIETNPLER